MNYEVWIGKIWDLDLKREVPKRKIVINAAQREILIWAAHKLVDNELKATYQINECTFMIQPHFGDENYYAQSFIEKREEVPESEIK